MHLIFISPIVVIAFLFVVASAIWVFIDATNLGVKRSTCAKAPRKSWVFIEPSNLGMEDGSVKGFFDLGPGDWAVGCVLFWIVAFPMYLWKREEYVELAKKRSQESSSVAPPSPPTTFYVYLQDQVKGPFSREQIKALLDVASVSADTPCCLKDSDWQTVASFIQTPPCPSRT
jgi:hypothetical protein